MISAAEDEDNVKLIPSIVEKVILPKLTGKRRERGKRERSLIATCSTFALGWLLKGQRSCKEALDNSVAHHIVAEFWEVKTITEFQLFFFSFFLSKNNWSIYRC